METQTRYDLNTAIENWRQELAAQVNLTAEVRRELETHLRDAITGFQQRGLNDDESFWLARRRIGQPQQLGEEFVKSNPAVAWRERVLWMAVACLVISLWETAINDSFLIFRFIRLSSLSPTWIQWLNSAVFRDFVFTVPVLWFAIRLAGSQMKHRRFLPTPLRFFAMAAVLVLMANLFNIRAHSVLSEMGQMKFKLPVTHEWVTTLLSQSFWPLMLVSLITWLLPSQNRKTPKRV